jgi:glutamate carboxypeptidase
MSEFVAWFEGQKQAMVDYLTSLVNYETPTTDPALVNKMVTKLEADFHALGASSVTRLPQEKVGDFMVVKFNENAPGKPLLFLIHTDTVWPEGTLAERPVTIDAEGKLFGPGAIDMKGGITIAMTALRGLRELNQFPDRPIHVLVTSDEEVGSIYSTPVIREVAAGCGLVLVMEPATQEGALKTWRKGLASFRLNVEGRASHAGNAPQKGINAVVEIAQQILAVNALNDLKNGTSVSVTMLEGGSAGNVIPAFASAYIDTRFMTMRAMQTIQEALGNLEPNIPGARVWAEPIHMREPMEHDEKMVRTFAQCQKIASEVVGQTAREDGSGGGSDGNITAAMGVPTLDGLGPQGDGLHALHEHVVINTLPQRAALCAAMLRDWVSE